MSNKIKKIELNRQPSLFDDKIQQVIGFLTRHYHIRIPVQDPSKIQITCKDKNRYVYPPSFDDISLHLMSEGINVSDSILRKIIRNPNQIAPVDPIGEYFDSIRGKWQGKSHIDLLCEHIYPRVWEEHEPEWYRQRTNKFLRKWLVACVACWLGGVPNEVAFGLVQSEGGEGKTFLTRFLLPDVLDQYYVMSSNREKNFAIEDAYTRYMIVNFEELNGLNRPNMNTFKAVQTAQFIETKLRHEEFPSRKRRIACGVFSTNFNQENGGFIQSWFGADTRRFGIIEIVGIDQSYSQKVDIDQLWSEALALYESESFDYIFRKADYNDFNDFNARYRFETAAMRIIQSFCTEGTDENQGEKLNPTQILQRLNQLKRIKAEDQRHMTSQKIGAALSALGYKKIQYRDKYNNNEPRNGYHIRFIE